MKGKRPHSKGDSQNGTSSKYNNDLIRVTAAHNSTVIHCTHMNVKTPEENPFFKCITSSYYYSKKNGPDTITKRVGLA